MSHTATCERTEHVHASMGEEGHPRPAAPARAREDAAPPVTWLLSVPEVRWSALSLALLLVGLGCRAAGAPGGVAAVAFAGCYASGGWQPALAGLRALRAKVLDVDLLMIVAALVAAGIGQAVDGGLLVVIFATSGALEAVATRRTRDSIRSLLDLAPERATRIDPDGSEQEVDAADLAVGDVVVVRPGERLGADGTVVEGASEVDQASITGEPLPVAKGPGAEVFAGTLNGPGMLRVRVDRAAGDTVVARIVALVEEASATKARTQLFVEEIEQRYSVGVVAATVALVAVPVASGAAFQPTLVRAMTFMIVASPCAVVLATMPPLLSAIANAGRHGVLVKSAVAMELLGHTDLVAFDKTGTLTEGAPELVTVGTPSAAHITADEVLQLAAAAEAGSEHPLGRAVVLAARERGWALPSAAGFLSLPGRGVEAVVDGHRVEVGKPASMGDGPPAGGPRLELSKLAAELQADGCTALVVTVDGVPAGVLGLADRARPGAAGAVAAVARATGRRPVLLTGDHHGPASLLAAEVGIDDVRAGLLPHDKVAAVRGLALDGLAVTVVGDGVNDAPSLAAAHAGVAMGRQGADLTLEAADAVLVHDELAALPAVMGLSRYARRVITQNLWIAAAVIVALVTLDLVGRLPLPLGVAGHEGSTVIVGLNGLRLLTSRSWARSS